jgi:hypothetical protein
MGDQAAQDLIYLANKRTALSNPGFKMDDVYYSQLNTTVDLAEITYNLGRYNVSFTQLGFGGSSLVTIPNQSLITGVYVYLQVPNVVANQTLPLGWGYALIKSVSYILGNSNVSQITLPQQALFQTLMLECETAEKRSELLRLGGEEITAPTTTPPSAYVFIPLPFSSVCGIKSKLPFDTSLLDNPINLQIELSRADEIYGGSGAFPTSILSARAYMRQGDFTNKDQSLRSVLIKNPDLMYTYPFIHRQIFPIAGFTGSTTNPLQFTLQSIINADFIGLTFGVIPTNKLSNNGVSCPDPFAYDPVQNVKLTFNGQTMYDAIGDMRKLVNILGTAGGGYFRNSIVNDSAIAPFSSNPVDSYLTFIDFSRIRAACFDGKYNNVWRIGNNSVVLAFTTSTTNTYSLIVTYHYNAVAEVQNGQSRIYFD